MKIFAASVVSINHLNGVINHCASLLKANNYEEALGKCYLNSRQLYPDTEISCSILDFAEYQEKLDNLEKCATVTS